MSRTVGDLSTLKTTDKTSLVSSINELFTFADNGKKNIATVIGSPLNTSDTFDSMKSEIQTMKNTFASNLTDKGQSSAGTEAMESLINKVAKISRMNVVSGVGQISSRVTTLERINGEDRTFGTLTINYNFGFIPQFIIITNYNDRDKYMDPIEMAIYIKNERHPSYAGELVFLNGYSTYDTVKLVSPLYVNSSGFHLPVQNTAFTQVIKFKHYVIGA